MDFTRAPPAPGELLAADQMGDLALPSDVDGLHGHPAAQLPRGTLALDAVLVRPEQRRRRHIDPFEPALDMIEVRLDEIAHLWAELIDQERAARTDHARCRLGDRVADARR